MRFVTPALALVGAAVLPVAARADVFYSNDFESGVIGPGWSTNAHLDTAAPLTHFMGRYSENTPQILNNSVSLTLPRPTDDNGNPGVAPYTLIFDFYAIDSWHGDDPTQGPDRFAVIINSVVQFDYTFSNTSATQTYRPPDVGPTQLGFGAAPDSIYRDIRIDFDVGSAPNIIIKWRSDGLTGVNNESWGIDNVRLIHNAPAPGSLALLGLGGAILGRRRRR